MKNTENVDPGREAFHANRARLVLSDMIEDLGAIADGRPDNGAEIMLAVRHLQDARMRLGVALAMEMGKNPWRN